jgi:DNA-binding SARP family transcriptional activator
VLAALALGDGPLERDLLADIVWDGTPPTSWPSSLRNTLSRLRRFLDRAAPGTELCSVGGSWQLQLPPGSSVDVVEAHRHLIEAESLIASGRALDAIEAASAAVPIMRGLFLPGWVTEWTERWRATIRDWRLRALDVLVAGHSIMGSYSAATAAANEAILVDPFREVTYRSLMETHLRAGDRAAGLAAYEQCRRLLAETLGVPPSPQTEAIYQALLGTDPVLGTHTTSETAPAPATGAIPQSGARRHIPSTNGAALLALPPRPHHFTGRHTEHRALAQAWAHIDHAGMTAAVISGAAGVGKSALVVEAAYRLASGDAIALYGTCSDASQPFQPIVEQLAGFLNAGGSSAFALLEDLAPVLTPLLPALRVRHPPRKLCQDPSITATSASSTEALSAARDELFGAVTAAYLRIAAERPTLLVFDDVQWAPAETCELLGQLLSAAKGASLLILVAHRDRLEPSLPIQRVLDRLAREPETLHLAVAGLGRRELTVLTSKLAPGLDPAAREALVDKIDAATDGNPLFALELLRAETANGERRDRRAESTPPASVVGLIDRRTRALPRDARQCLMAAAAAGPVFDVPTVCAATAIDESEAVDAFELATREYLVEPEHGPLARYRFTHALVRDAVLASIPGPDRTKLHLTIAEAWQARVDAPARSGEILSQLLAAGDRADPRRVVAAAMRSGQAAIDERAFTTAAARFAIACDRAPDDRTRCRALLKMAESQAAAGDLDQARRTTLTAVDAARRAGNDELFAHAVLGLARGGQETSAWFAPELDRDLLDEAADRLASGTDVALRIRVMGQLAAALHRPGEHQRRTEIACQAVELARSLGDETVLAATLTASRIALNHPRDTPARRAMADEVLRIAARRNDLPTRIDARFARISDAAELADRVLVEADLAEVERETAHRGDLMSRWRVAAWRALLTIVDGDVTRGSRLSDRALEMWGADPNATAVRTWGGHQLTALTITGRVREASALAREGVDRYGTEVPGYRCALALTLALSGDLDEASDQIRRFLVDPGLDGWRIDSSWLCGAVCLAEAIALTGDGEAAQLLLPRLEPARDRLAFAGGLTGLCFWGATATAVGLLLCTIGHHAEAAAALRSGAHQCATFGAKPWAHRAEAALESL